MSPNLPLAAAGGVAPSPMAAKDGAAKKKTPMYTLYTAATPNGWKVSILLEELGVDYEVYQINFQVNEQKSDWYTKINPNGRIPALVDHSRNDFCVFESGAILLYLAEKHKRFCGDNDLERSQIVQWIMFQMAGIAPMQSQANHFLRYAPERLNYAIDKYVKETERLYEILDKQLGRAAYMIGDDYTIADMVHLPFILCYSYINIDIRKFRNLERWVRRLLKRDGVRRGLNVPAGSLANLGIEQWDVEAK